MAPRARVLALVLLAAAGAAGLAVGGALLQSEGAEDAAGAARTAAPPALQLNVFGRGREARALRAAERAYEKGDTREALARFRSVLRGDPTSVEAAVGAAVASWPEGTIAALEDLAAEHPANGVARLHLGLALVARGEVEAAREEWREAERRDPDSPSALEAENLLHPRMLRGRPYFIAAGTVPPRLARLPLDEQLAALRRRAARGGAAAWMEYGAELQRVGRPLSARMAFDRAVALAPGAVTARVAAAVSRFEKDNPAAAFSRLGPLAREHPRSAVVRFHLGYLLLWLGDLDEAKRQLRLGAEVGGAGVYGRTARRLLAALREK